MSGANAIHGIILVGAIIVAGQADVTLGARARPVAVLLATMNLVGGFVVTDRMLEMFRPAGRGRRRDDAQDGRPVPDVEPRSATSSPRSASSSPSRGCPRRHRPARQPDRRGRRGARRASSCSSSEDLDHLVPILGAIAVGSAIAVPAARRVQMTQMPQLVALFNGVGGGAAALVAAARAVGTSAVSRRRRRVAAFTVLIGAVSFSARCVTFAKLQELMTTRPVLFPGGPLLFGGSVAAAVALGVAVVVDATTAASRRGCWSCCGSSRSSSACCSCCRSAAPTCRS